MVHLVNSIVDVGSNGSVVNGASFHGLSILTFLLTFSVFYHLGGVNVFHHDSPAFSVSGHLWVDAIDAHVTCQSVKPSHLWTSSGSGSHHHYAQRASCYVGLFAPHAHTRIVVFGSGPI